ncbi:hypothetical protein Afe04nite_42760 [Asanoa ferruginea]|nr:hypothetical protein Afe04nite_42760 [Asanoa ferruginea]
MRFNPTSLEDRQRLAIREVTEWTVYRACAGDVRAAIAVAEEDLIPSRNVEVGEGPAG